MCGIAGIFGHCDDSLMDKMLGALVHRGPDDVSRVGSGNFSLGARRLSIIDPSGGRQPCSNETDSIWAVLNGEVYNFAALREELSSCGHSFRSRSDTETIPHLFEEYGEGLCTKLDGMFAVGIWSSTSQTGYLIRDRVGKKPLYYRIDKGNLFFASEIKALLVIPNFARRVNPEALNHFLSLKHVPNPLSIFREIYQVPPGHILSFQPGDAPVLKRYWEIDFLPDPDAGDLKDEDVTSELERLLRASIRRRLISDVPIGFCLSGGIDSSLVVALAAEECSALSTFSLVYGDTLQSEGKQEDQRWARAVARKYATSHHEQYVTAEDIVDGFESVLRSFDEPFVGVFSSYFLCRLIRRFVKVALSGDGADELFGSYLSHRLAHPLAHFAKYQITAEPALLRPFETEVDFLSKIYSPYLAEWRAALFMFSEEEKQKLYTPDYAEACKPYSTTQYLRGHCMSLSATDPLNRILELEFKTIFPDQVLAYADRLSMANSVEVRSPFLDQYLVRYVAKLPAEFKIRDGQTKRILKNLAQKFLPAELVNRRKEGFVMPESCFLSDRFKQYVHEELSPSRVQSVGIFCEGSVRSLIHAAFSKADYQSINRMMSVLSVHTWHRLYF